MIIQFFFGGILFVLDLNSLSSFLQAFVLLRETIFRNGGLHETGGTQESSGVTLKITRTI